MEIAIEKILAIFTIYEICILLLGLILVVTGVYIASNMNLLRSSLLVDVELLKQTVKNEDDIFKIIDRLDNILDEVNEITRMMSAEEERVEKKEREKRRYEIETSSLLEAMKKD